jgi:hypothetical protein
LHFIEFQYDKLLLFLLSNLSLILIKMMSIAENIPDYFNSKSNYKLSSSNFKFYGDLSKVRSPAVWRKTASEARRGHAEAWTPNFARRGHAYGF